MPINIAVKAQKTEQAAIEAQQAEMAAKHKADKAESIQWKPTFSRIKVQPDPEQLSSILKVEAKNDYLVRGTIVAMGPEVGFRDGKKVEDFRVGQRILYFKSHVQEYEGANGIKHYFLKESSDVNSVCAVEPVEEIQ